MMVNFLKEFSVRPVNFEDWKLGEMETIGQTVYAMLLGTQTTSRDTVMDS